MLYALLCYHDEKVVTGWSKDQDDAVLAKREKVTGRLAAQGKLGPAARLMPTTAAATVKMGPEPVVLDGPFAETKEQLLGFYIVECETLEDAVALAKDIGREETVTFEIRPLRLYKPGGKVRAEGVVAQ